MAWPEGQGRLSNTTLEGCSLSTSQEARAAATGHAHRLWSGTHKEVISNEGPRAGNHQPHTSKL